LVGNALEGCGDKGLGKLRFGCPECGKTISVSGEAKKARCPKCKTVFEVSAALAAGLDPSTELTEPAWAGQGKSGRGQNPAKAYGERVGGDTMPKEKKERAASGGDGKPFNEMVDDIVGKAVPQKWLATAFGGTAILALILLILTIAFSFSAPATDAETDQIIKDEKDKAAAKVAKYEEIAKQARDDAAAAKKAQGEAQSELRTVKRKADAADSNIASAQAKQKKAEDAYEKLKEKYADLEKNLNAEIRAKREAESKLKSAEREAASATAKESATATRLERTETGLKELRVKYDALSRQKMDESKRVEQAKATFEGIMNKAAAEEDLSKRLELLKTLSEKSAADLGGTRYERDLGSAIIAVQELMERQEALAKRAATKDAAETYATAMRELKMTKDYAKSMEILRKAKEEVAGSKYEVAIHNQIQSREKAEKERLARAVYDAAMKRLRDEPNAYEENLRALKAAMEETADTSWAARLKKLVDARTKSLAGDIARGAYDTLNAQIRKSPPDYDANITAAEDALEKAKGTRYEAKIKGILTSQQTSRLTAIGLAAYKACIAQVKSSRDYEANVATLEAEKAKAAGSVYEAKIDKLLAGQRKYLEREKARNE